MRAIWFQGMFGWELSRLAGKAFTASPISSRRMRTASDTSPSDKSPRSKCDRIAAIACWMSSSRWRSR